ncbi:hypothetical protein [Dokdonella sp.]|uniref:hypothetical protein n=1 Tax=Dokdonella sp. TaxID=2291710 RepID=UPI002F418427
MTHDSATRRLRLSVLARVRAARVLVGLFAIALALGGYLAAAAPLHAAAAATASAGTGEGCGHEGMAMPSKHGHASDSCCRVACACAFVHAIGAVAPLACARRALASASPLALSDARAPGLANPPPLRPPIA